MGKRSKILVVDDENRNLRLMEALLIPLGYEVILARDGEEALEKVREIPPDVVLLDIMMPKMDGLELTRRIKAEYPSIPILIVTGNGPVYDLLKSGAAACITKPFNIFELQNMVKTILERIDKG